MKKTLIILIIIAIALLLLPFIANTYLRTSRPASTDIPLPNHEARPQLLRFGMYVTPDPDQNPIDPPERFTGYHTALDFEILPGEKTQEIPVRAVCDGPVVQSGFIEGYGGAVIQQCTLNSQTVTTLYGHLKTESLASPQAQLQIGEQLGILADHNSEDSGQTRKHLHLGIHKGPEIDVRGYVQNEEELGSFLDPKQVLDL